MTRVILIRHGETDWNAEGRWQGQADVLLNPRGRQQAQRLAVELQGKVIQAIYSSDLQRAVATAQPLAELTGLAIQVDPRLREIHQGEWQGMLVSDIRERYAEAFARRIRDPRAVAPPGGESFNQVLERARTVVEEIIARHRGGVVAIVAHGYVIAVLRIYLQGLPVQQLWDLIPKSAQWIEINLDGKWNGEIRESRQQ